MPLNGSSSSSTSGSCTSAAATLIRWRMPLEYVEIRRPAASAMSAISIARPVAAPTFGRPCSLALARTNFSPVRNPYTESRSGTSPIVR